MKHLLQTSLLFFALFFYSNVFSQWIKVGDNLGFASSESAPSLAIDPNTSDLYIAYPDGAVNAFVVRRFDGEKWVQTGDNLGFASSESAPSLAIDPNTSDLYITYPDGAVNAFAVRRFDGEKWVQTGDNLGFASSESAPSLAIDPNTSELYIAYPDGAVNAFVIQKDNIITATLKQFDSSNQLSIYPNPTADFMTLLVTGEASGSAYTLTNSLGVQMLTGKLTGATTLIDLSQLAADVYFLQIRQGNQFIKVIKK